MKKLHVQRENLIFNELINNGDLCNFISKLCFQHEDIIATRNSAIAGLAHQLYLIVFVKSRDIGGRFSYDTYPTVRILPDREIILRDWWIDHNDLSLSFIIQCYQSPIVYPSIFPPFDKNELVCSIDLNRIL